MEGMFTYTGYTAMTSLDLGDDFDTTKVLNMRKMFYGTGNKKMNVLDLGAKFVKIPENNTNMFKDCGNSELEIYSPEAIYSNEKSFKLGH